MDFDESILTEFALEGGEHLERVEQDLLLIAQAKEGSDAELIHQVFRGIHSIKGSAGFLPLPRMQTLAHEMETLLDQVRDDPGTLRPAMVDVLLDGVDLLKAMMEDILRSDEIDIEPVHRRLCELTASGSDAPASDPTDSALTGGTGFSNVRFDFSPETLKKIPISHEYLYVLRYDLMEAEQTDGKSPAGIFKDLQGLGTIVDAVMPSSGIDPSEPLPDGPFWCIVLYSTILGPEFLDEAAGLPEDRIFALDIETLPDIDALLISGDSGEVSLIDSDHQAPAYDPGDQDRPDTHPSTTPETEPSPPAAESIAQFVLDSDDLLEKVERHLSGIGKDSEQNRVRIGEVFPLIHALQEHAGLSGLTSFERFSREMVHFLNRFLNGTSQIDDTERDLLLKGVDLLQEGLWELSVHGTASFPEAAAFFSTASAGPDADRRSEKQTESEDKRIAALSGSAGFSSSLGVMRQDIRVDLGKLDLLINLVGELVTAESMVTRNTDLEGLALTHFDRATHGLRRIISELQDVAMSVRLIPLSGTFRRLDRLVRDLSAKAGKPVTLTVSGENTEVDKTVLEQIGDPLVHLIRNSIDHGIEPREERRSKGKKASGMIRIEARQESGEILIRFSDDGAGLNPKKIRAQAVARGLAEADDIDARPDPEVYRFIFESGFTTQEDIAHTPGRGIGMEVVKKNIERLRGRVDIASVPGEGTEVTLRIPMTMAVLDGMLIRVGPISYTLPLNTIRESFRPTPEQITTTLGGQEWVRVRDSFMPVIRLHRLYNLVPDTENLDQGILINAASDSRHFCLFVDEIIGHHQAVIKSVPEYIGNTAGVSGCTILNNGEVGLILDMGGIMELAERIHRGEKPRQAKTH